MMTIRTIQLSFIVLLGAQACGGDGNPASIGGSSAGESGFATGGATSANSGASAGISNGDASNRGGASGAGSGGAVSKGGGANSGGAATALLGGAPSAGGAIASGGSTGGANANGGSAMIGGAANTGGNVGKGGAAVGVGGAMALGGRASSGGAATGGAATGGAATGGAATGGATGCRLAFPGAQGFGRCATGARGGSVYHVTTLADSGPGSLRDAISVANRTVVFDVSGVIKLSSRLVFKNNLTIAGQTAPGGGIVVYGDGTSFSNANDTIVRYVRFRMGISGESGKDTVTMAAGHDVIFDHCSISWGRDGNFDLNKESGSELYNITLQDSIVSQGLQTHSTGGLVVNGGTSIIRSLYIDNNSRNPKARGTTQFVNNVVYNWIASGYILGDTAGRSDGALLGNYFISGPETNGKTLDSPTPEYHVYAVGNYYDSDKDGILDGRLLGKGDFGTATWETAPSVSFPDVPVMTADEAFAYVRDHAGASIYRDAVDSFVVNELKSLGKSGKTISDEASLGLSDTVGTIPTGTVPKDTDGDGMSDAWESAVGLDPTNANDRNADRNGDGWTNLEEYVNSLAK